MSTIATHIAQQLVHVIDVDFAIRRAAGVMLWALEHGATVEAAVAKASAREPDLKTAQLQYAFDWAEAARCFRDLAREWPEDRNLGDLLDASGLRKFIDENPV